MEIYDLRTKEKLDEFIQGVREGYFLAEFWIDGYYYDSIQDVEDDDYSNFKSSLSKAKDIEIAFFEYCDSGTISHDPESCLEEDSLFLVELSQEELEVTRGKERIASRLEKARQDLAKLTNIFNEM